MSCHGKQLKDGAMLWVCVSPIMGFTPEAEWISQELKMYNHTKIRRKYLKQRLSILQRKQERKELIYDPHKHTRPSR